MGWTGLKEQWVEQTPGSRLAAAYYALVTAIEDEALDRGVDPARVEVDERILDPSWVMHQLETGRLAIRAAVAERIIVEAAGAEIVVEPDPGVWGVPLESLYRLAPRAVLSGDSSLLKRLAYRTAVDGIEYLVLYPESGEALVLEGEYLRVSVPFARVAASIHTHPEGPCGLSSKDVESALDLLAEGGLFEAAVTTSCAALVYRVGPVQEDDYIIVREALLRRRLDDDKLRRLKSIVFEQASY